MTIFMSEPHVAHTKPLNRTQNLTESRGRLASQADVFRGARLSSLVGRDGRRAPLKMPAWETSGRRTVTIPVFDKSAKCFWLNAVLNAEARPQGTHTMCVCNSLLFYSKCSGFTVCFIYDDISLSMYINQCKINVELPHLWYIVVLLPQKRFFERFWRILSSQVTTRSFYY